MAASNAAQSLAASGKRGVTKAGGKTRGKAQAVTPAAVTPAGSDGMIGKAALCEALGWTRPKLDRRLDSDEKFPIAQRGTRAGGWAFDLAAVRTYLESGSQASAPAAAAHFDQRIDPKASSNPYPGAKYSVVPPAGVEPVVHSGEQSARQRRDAVQAEILEDKLRRDRGELVQAEVMRQVITKMLVHLGKGLDRLSDQVVDKLGLPESNADDIRDLTDDLRATMVDELNVLLGPDA
ncbi:hypothetical protein LMG24238_06908 [Paraburkholderia sediminicola]|uniref:Uncharacterized protein n=1 Tax=Paraburkholderia sediminicola TaxID=458836 RepID=A0A6J5CSC3_9BURK|nr:hypothetical protein [Paraburkholderia sediminicola]CAB3742602.1 hypothetical protein LMG24238_06908 [Paraburkholderia sediminicola]